MLFSNIKLHIQIITAAAAIDTETVTDDDDVDNQTKPNDEL
mgnify:CR=1 FL=1